MKNLFTLLLASTCLFTACNNAKTDSKTAENNSTASSNAGGEYFEFAVDGKNYNVDAADVLTSYNEFGKLKEFKIFAGKEGGATLTITIPNDMSAASTTPSGSNEAGNSIGQGSVSLQDYPEKGTTNNNFDFMANPPLQPVADAVVVTSSQKIGEEGRMIAGTINTKTVADADGKQYSVTGRFSIKHLFKGLKF